MSDVGEKEKLIKLMEYWLDHNEEHLKENIEWMKKAGDLGLDDIVHGLSHVVEYFRKINEEFDEMLHMLKGEKHATRAREHHVEYQKHDHIHIQHIGIIKTPFSKSVPQDGRWREFECRIVIDESLKGGLYRLESFSHIYVLFYMHRLQRDFELKVTPPSGGGIQVGVFASRSPVRPNPVGVTITEIKRIEDNVIYTGGIDAIDGSPLIDIKPYIKTQDCIGEANDGWLAKGD